MLQWSFAPLATLCTGSSSFSSFWGRLLDHWFDSFILSYRITFPPVSMTAASYKFPYYVCSFQPSSSYFPVILKASLLVNEFLSLCCLISKYLILGEWACLSDINLIDSIMVIRHAFMLNLSFFCDHNMAFWWCFLANLRITYILVTVAQDSPSC